MQNPRQWAKDNLSPARYRAFLDALSELESKKLSAEHWEKSRELDAIERAHVVNHSEEMGMIREKAHNRAKQIEELIRQLREEERTITKEAEDKIYQIRAQVYTSEEYKAKDEERRAIWRRDDEQFQPKVQALIDKYQKAQEKASA